MKRLTAILIAAAAVVGTSYVGNVGAGEYRGNRTVDFVSVYNCNNGQEVAMLYSGRTPTGEIWAQVQGSNWLQRFDYMSPIAVASDPGLTGEQRGVRLTIRILANGAKLDVAYADKGLFNCDYVENINLVSYRK